MTEHVGFKGVESRFICLQCTLREFVEQLERGEDPMLAPPRPLWIEGTIDNHLATAHPDQAETQRERADLEARAQAGFERLQRRRAAGVENAKNN